MGLCPCHSRKHTHPVGMVHCWESECRGGTQGLLPGCCPSPFWCPFPCFPPVHPGASTEWRKAEINLEGKWFCLSGQTEGSCLIDFDALISFYELPGVQSPLFDPLSELAGAQQDLC